jgi:murein DD-endopeptidase MepM/ murein hydrolase activator NlpD
MKPNRKVLLLLFTASALLIDFLPKSVSANASEGWRTPVDNPVLAREFRQPSADWSAGHRGVDYQVALKQTVFAAHSGIIAFAGTVVNRGVLTIRHEDGLITSYEPVCTRLPSGSLVSTGQQVGMVCPATDYHSHCGIRLCLHFSMRDENGYLSPLVKIGGLSPSRLKPWGGLRCNPLSSVQC